MNVLLFECYMDFLVVYDFNLFISLDGDEYGIFYRVNKVGDFVYFNIIRNIDVL